MVPGLLHAQTPRQVLAKLAVHSVSQSEDALLDFSAIAAQKQKRQHRQTGITVRVSTEVQRSEHVARRSVASAHCPSEM